jgi:hypothetical protein
MATAELHVSAPIARLGDCRQDTRASALSQHAAARLLPTWHSRPSWRRGTCRSGTKSLELKTRTRLRLALQRTPRCSEAWLRLSAANRLNRPAGSASACGKPFLLARVRSGRADPVRACCMRGMAARVWLADAAFCLHGRRCNRASKLQRDEQHVPHCGEHEKREPQRRRPGFVQLSDHNSCFLQLRCRIGLVVASCSASTRPLVAG